MDVTERALSTYIVYIFNIQNRASYYNSYLTKPRGRDRAGDITNMTTLVTSWGGDLHLALSLGKHTTQIPAGVCVYAFDKGECVLGSEVQITKNKVTQRRLSFWRSGSTCYLLVDTVAMGSTSSQDTGVKVSGTWNLRVRNTQSTLGQTGAPVC